MKQTTNIKEKAVQISMDAVIWATDHIKEIGIGLGLLGLATVSHRMGYHKAQREMVSGFDKAWRKMVEEALRGGDVWTT